MICGICLHKKQEKKEECSKTFCIQKKSLKILQRPHQQKLFNQLSSYNNMMCPLAKQWDKCSTTTTIKPSTSISNSRSFIKINQYTY